MEDEPTFLLENALGHMPTAQRPMAEKYAFLTEAGYNEAEVGAMLEIRRGEVRALRADLQQAMLDVHLADYTFQETVSLLGTAVTSAYTDR